MGLHSLQNVIEGLHGFYDVLALVQHDALGSLATCGIGDFGAGCESVLGNAREDLRGPNHRYVSRLADPQDLFLDLRKTLQPLALDRQ